MRKALKAARVIITPGMVLFLSMSLFACTQVGRQIPPAELLSLGKAQVEEGLFSRDGLHVAYRYDRRGDTLRIWGRVAYNLPVESLDVYLLFIDAGGTVVDQEWLYSTGYSVSKLWGRSRAFDRDLQVPKSAVAISFDSSAVLSRGHQ